MLSVVCVNWRNYQGCGAKYTNILHSAVKRNLRIPFQFFSITDNGKGLHEDIQTIPIERNLKGWWNKLAFFKGGLFPDRALFLDLDVCITGSLDELVEVDAPFCIISDWHLPCFNSSVMVLDPWTHPEVWEDFRTHQATPGGDQQWITDKVPDAAVFPSQWCVSYRSHAQPGVPKGAKVVVFHGLPKPDSYPSAWVMDYWK